ncbi:relaxase/mobilization nuclease domain-containing protein [Butyrivibrio sp. AE3004]|uniref:relaxase/mobilization nuclease domain-containing protein n=1 Tax=Butyrivibrio sp. AE3004 TaxID=1506994 RepID=UPI0004944934|nr:relaxase/mobilization nuclease domain-containing protein [Butyrivibrio sp. AE3004]
MAATRLIAMHQNAGKSIGQCLSARLDYVTDEEKTRKRNEDEEEEKSKYITSYACNAAIAKEEFMDSRNEYVRITGRQYEGDIIAYQIRQSFKPGEVTPEEANAIGYETAMRFTRGQHQFVCCTHVDKEHIHNHIVYNSVNLHCDKKFRDSWFCGIGLRTLSDMICLEHGLSVIEPYKHKGKKPVYQKSYRQVIRDVIDKILAEKPKDFESFISELKKAGFEIKEGKHLAIKSPGRKNFVRFDSLGKDYSAEALKAKFEGSEISKDSRKGKPFDLLIDIQEKIRQGKGKGYINWSQKFNNKAMMKTLLYLNDKGIRSYAELKDKADTSSASFKKITDNLKAVEGRIDKLSNLRKHILAFSKTKAVFEEYKKKRYSKAFFEAHREEITKYRAAKKAFNEYGQKLPTVKEINKEIDQLMHDKKALYKEYYLKRDDNKSLQEAKRNVEMFLQMDNKEADKQKQRTQPVR